MRVIMHDTSDRSKKYSDSAMQLSVQNDISLIWFFKQVQTKKDPECVKVIVRCRPMSRKETEDGRIRIVEMDSKTGEVLPLPACQGENCFTF
jgi:hypothetical protein